MERTALLIVPGETSPEDVMDYLLKCTGAIHHDGESQDAGTMFLVSLSVQYTGHVDTEEDPEEEHGRGNDSTETD